MNKQPPFRTVQLIHAESIRRRLLKQRTKHTRGGRRRRHHAGLAQHLALDRGGRTREQSHIPCSRQCMGARRIARTYACSPARCCAEGLKRLGELARPRINAPLPSGITLRRLLRLARSTGSLKTTGEAT